MKRLNNLILGATLLFSSCQTNKPGIMGLLGDEGYTRIYRLYTEACKIEPTPDVDSQNKPADYWKSPEETRKLGKGDCEDFAIYLNSLWNHEGIRGRIVIGYLNQGDNDKHAWNEIIWNDQIFIADASAKRFALKKSLPRNMYIEDNEKSFAHFLINFMYNRHDKGINYGNMPSGVFRGK